MQQDSGAQHYGWETRQQPVTRAPPPPVATPAVAPSSVHAVCSAWKGKGSGQVRAQAFQQGTASAQRGMAGAGQGAGPQGAGPQGRRAAGAWQPTHMRCLVSSEVAGQRGDRCSSGMAGHGARFAIMQPSTYGEQYGSGTLQNIPAALVAHALHARALSCEAKHTRSAVHSSDDVLTRSVFVQLRARGAGSNGP